MAAEVSLFRASDGYEFYVHRYRPTGPTVARVVVLHGIRSHAVWYEASCQKLADDGYDVHFLERRGSGWNTARRGDCPSVHRLIDDVAESILELRRTRAGLPLFLVGISWGGKLAVALAARYPTIFSGIALLCPGLKPAVHPPWKTRLRIALASRLRPTKLFPIPLNEPELFTASPEWQRFIDADRFGLRQATARFLFNSFRFDRFLRREYRKVTCPVLLMLAGQDRILNNAATRKLLAKFTRSRRVSIIDYPKAQHTLEFEPASHPWLNDLMMAFRQGLAGDLTPLAPSPKRRGGTGIG